MSQSLMELIVAYGDACGDRDGNGLAPVELAAVEQRIGGIRDAAIQIGVDGETISALLDGDES